MAAILVVASVALLVPLPQNTRAVAAVFDLMHAPLFAMLAFLGARTWQARRGGSTSLIAAAVWLVLCGFGAGIELLQGLVERFPSWNDALANALGAGAGVLGFAAVRLRPTAGVLGCVGAAALLIGVASWSPVATLVDWYRQRRDVSLLASFEDSLELRRWTAQNASMERSREYVTHGEWSLRLDLAEARYPGMESLHLPRDWSRFEELVFDVALPEGPELRLVVKIYDERHNMETEDRFHAVIPLKPGPHRVRIPLEDVARAPQGREMDLTRIRCLQFFAVAPRDRRTLFFDNVRLR